MRIEAIIFSCSMLCLGCTTAYRATSSQEFGNRVSGSDGTIVRRNGMNLSAEGISISGDSLLFRNEDTMRDTCVRLSDVESVILSNRTRGAIDGAVLGVLGAGSLGFIGGGVAAVSSSAQDRGLNVGLGAYNGVIIGGALGMVGGFVFGHHTKCVPPRDSMSVVHSTSVAP
jgi:hypothetical protein